MSSPAGSENATSSFKKRKLPRACDLCRGKKIKCDGSDMPNNRCSKCVARSIECTYVLAQNSGYPRSYVEDLESRLEHMEKLMSKFLSDKEPAREVRALASGPSDALMPTSEQSHPSGSLVETPRTPSALVVAPPTSSSVVDDSHGEEEEAQELEEELAEGMRKLSMHSPPLRYHGKSSGLVLIRSAMALKNEYSGFQPTSKGDGQQPWVKAFVEGDFPVLEESNFPPRNLLDVLVDLYFCHMNCHFPLLHEPTFKRSIEVEEHLLDGRFGATVLLVCAIGSRFTRDPRVLLDGSDHHQSAGWKWFLHIERVRRMSFAPAKIYDLQIYVLTTLSLQGTTTPQAIWSVVGAGIRVALDVGAHRRQMYSLTPNVEDELWRRTFWILVSFEWIIGYGLGRPSCIHDEDFDLALPTECDDEYWLTPDGEPLFKQPPGKPSKVTAFVCMLRLGQILAFSMRTIYSTNKSRVQLGQSDQQWESRIVAELDSALNKWSDSLPSHLRWNPREENVLLLTQAATLNAYYHYTQVAVHRTFVESPRRGSPLSSPSDIICMNGARSAIQVLETLYIRTGSPNHRNMGALFLSGFVLTANLYALKCSGRVINLAKDLGLVTKASEMLRALRYETHIAESLGDMLVELMSAVKEPLPPAACLSADAQGLIAHTTEESRQTSSLTSLLLEGLPSVQHTEDPDIRKQANAGEATDAALHIPSGLDFLRPDPLAFAPTLGLGDQGPSVLPPGYGFFPRRDAPQVAHPRSDANQGSHGQNPFPMGNSDGRMFDLDPLGYNESMSFLPSISESHGATNNYAQQRARDPGASGAIEAGGRMPDFALTDDAFDMAWSNLPPEFR